ATGAGLAGILAAGVPPARAQQREVSYLCWNNFAPNSDKKLAEIGQRFTKDTGIKLKIDHISHMGPQQNKYASEVQVQAGHDLVRSEEHTSELQSPDHLVCRLLLEKKKLIARARMTTTRQTAHTAVPRVCKEHETINRT